MSDLCARCGIGRGVADDGCDWCGALRRARLPLWTAAKRWLRQSAAAAALRQRGPLVTGVAVGVALHLAVAAVGVATGISPLWETGLLWSVQWWWMLAPEAVRPWAFAAMRGAVYGLLAGWLASLWAEGRHGTSRRLPAAEQTGGGVESGARDSAPASVRPAIVSPVGLTALAAYVVSGWEPGSELGVGTQFRLVAAAVGAGVGRLTMLIAGGARTRTR